MIAVLTGDLVESSKYSASNIDIAMQSIGSAAQTIATLQNPPAETRFTRYRGDGWQIYLERPRFSLRTAVVIQATLTALNMESRISIGIGHADSLGTANLADAAGKAFEDSGRGLDDMAQIWRVAISGESVQDSDHIIADLLGERMQKWTAAQAAAAAIQLASPNKVRTLFDIGRELNISPQAVNDRVRGAGCAQIASALRRWETQYDRRKKEYPHA